MADPKLCRTCQEKKPDYSLRGTCQASQHLTQHQLPADHDPWTRSINFSLCDACAEHFQFCAWCWGPLDGHAPITVPTDKRFCRVFEKEHGKHVEGMYVGEQILVQFTVDRFAGYGWRVKSTSAGVYLVATRMITEIEYENSWGWQWLARYGTLEMYFDLDELDPKAHIELEQVASYWWYSLASPKTWKCTIEVTQN